MTTANSKPYATKKESRVEWLEGVPRHWKVSRLKHVCRIAYGDALSADMRQRGNIAVFGSNGRVGFHHLANTQSPCIVIGRKGSFGKVSYSQEPVFAIDTTFFVDRRLSHADLRWLFYVMGWLGLDQLSKDAAVPGLSREDAYCRIVPLPPHREQITIARFLDHIDRLIRRYIRSKQKLIALLEEQKQAVIHQAVTGQIDVRTGEPYPSYKASGVDWLRNIPVHWKMVRNGRLFVQRNEIGFPKLPVLEVSLKTGVRVRDFENSDRKQAMSDWGNYKRAMKGDIAYNMMRMWQGAVGITPVDGLVSPAYVVAKALPESDPRYFASLFRTSAYMVEVDKYSRGIVKDRNRLYWEDFKQIPSPCPPPDEQVLVADAIDHNAVIIGEWIQQAERQIDLVREYRTRIIADVVTGNLDVRSAVTEPPA